jgi:hypothetical protein
LADQRSGVGWPGMKSRGVCIGHFWAAMGCREVGRTDVPAYKAAAFSRPS